MGENGCTALAAMQGLGADPHQAGKNYDQAEGENDDSGPVPRAVVLKEGLDEKSVELVLASLPHTRSSLRGKSHRPFRRGP